MLARHSHVASMADNQEALRVPPPQRTPGFQRFLNKLIIEGIKHRFIFLTQ